LHGLNVEGMKRRGFDKAKIDAIHKAYRIVFRSKLKIPDAMVKIRNELPALPELEQFTSFIAASERGVCR